MAKDEHSEGVVVDQFCALRTETCPYEKSCGNNYKENCKPRWAYMDFGKIGSATRIDYKKLIKPSSKKVNCGYEAHHILCVSSVTKCLAKNKKIRKIVRQTDWCINNRDNMIALPLFGHTVQWYCNVAKDYIRFAMNPPPFKNLPNHDFDHNNQGGYTDEIDGELNRLAGQIQKAGHKYKPTTLAAKLDGLSSRYRGELLYRGRRLGGTHKGWQTGLEEPEPDSEWYLPFSMAADGKVTKTAFVAGFTGKPRDFISSLADKMKEIAGKL